MISIKFDQSNIVLRGGTAAEFDGHHVNDMHAWTDRHGRFVSCWKLSLRERISALVFGRVWLDYLAAPHPVGMTARLSVFPRLPWSERWSRVKELLNKKRLS